MHCTEFTATHPTFISPLSLHDALPIYLVFLGAARELFPLEKTISFAQWMGFGVAYLVLLIPVCWLLVVFVARVPKGAAVPIDRKSTRLNSSHLVISYAVFCL